MPGPGDVALPTQEDVQVHRAVGDLASTRQLERLHVLGDDVRAGVTGKGGTARDGLDGFFNQTVGDPPNRSMEAPQWTSDELAR
jgi:hypothetical protein